MPALPGPLGNLAPQIPLQPVGGTLRPFAELPCDLGTAPRLLLHCPTAPGPFGNFIGSADASRPTAGAPPGAGAAPYARGRRPAGTAGNGPPQSRYWCRSRPRTAWRSGWDQARTILCDAIPSHLLQWRHCGPGIGLRSRTSPHRASAAEDEHGPAMTAAAKSVPTDRRSEA